jgi:transporter family-2 protein
LSSAGTLLFALITFIVGFSVPIQTGINAQLGKHLGHPVLASLISFCVGTAAMVLITVVAHLGWPSGGKLSEIPWWAWTGGLFGAIFVTMAIVMAPRLGASNTLCLIVAGQMLASLVFDHYGYLGFPEHPANWMRILGVVLLLAGVFLIQRF